MAVVRTVCCSGPDAQSRVFLFLFFFLLMPAYSTNLVSAWPSGGVVD